MPDIIMCKGEGCPLKEKCYLHNAEPSEYRQSYFVTPPVKDGACEYFWEEKRDEKKELPVVDQGS